MQGRRITFRASFSQNHKLVTFIFENHGKYFCHRKAIGVLDRQKSQETENDDGFVKQFSTDHVKVFFHGPERMLYYLKSP